jgi:anti-sigma regulatory factor (Ser/Thr protein kinase)
LLPYIAASVAVARRRLTADLLGAGIREPATQDAALVVSELLSNSLRHARPLPGGDVRVSWLLCDGLLELTVSDGGSATRPHATQPSLSSLGGRGLSIVTHLSRRWGVCADDRGTTVWVVLAAPSANGHGGAEVGSVTQRRNGDTQSGMALTRQWDGTGGDGGARTRRGQRGRPSAHCPAPSSGGGTAADNPSA